jgi:hypothetical protein
VLIVLFQLSLFCPRCPATIVLSWFSSPICPVLSFLTILLCVTCHGRPATVVLSQLSSPAGLSLLFCPSYLSQRSCPPVFLSSLSCPCFHNLTVLSQLSWMLSCHVLAVMSLQSRAVYPALSICPVQVNLSGLTCPSCPILTIKPLVYCAGCPTTVVPSPLSSPALSLLK